MPPTRHPEHPLGRHVDDERGIRLALVERKLVNRDLPHAREITRLQRAELRGERAVMGELHRRPIEVKEPRDGLDAELLREPREGLGEPLRDALIAIEPRDLFGHATAARTLHARLRHHEPDVAAHQGQIAHASRGHIVHRRDRTATATAAPNGVSPGPELDDQALGRQAEGVGLDLVFRRPVSDLEPLPAARPRH
jgi:hypothetical protein